jgi:hypothetical protein
MKSYFELVVLFLLSCFQRNVVDLDINKKFELFEKKFNNVRLPLNINDSLVNLTNKEVIPLDTNEVSLFFEPNKIFSNKVSLYKMYKYYPLFRFETTNNISVIVKKSGGSGGIENLYYLINYNKNCKIKSTLLIAKYIGDCSRLENQNCIIKLNGDININKFILTTNCDNGNIISVDSLTCRFNIDTLMGRIENCIK